MSLEEAARIERPSAAKAPEGALRSFSGAERKSGGLLGRVVLFLAVLVALACAGLIGVAFFAPRLLPEEVRARLIESLQAPDREEPPAPGGDT